MFANRSKNFEKTGEYATAWKKDEDGKMAVDGPRVVVGDQSQVPQGGFITRLLASVVSYLLVMTSYGLWPLACSVRKLGVCAVLSLFHAMFLQPLDVSLK